MQVKGLLEKNSDSCQEIAINEYSGQEHTGRRIIIKPHQTDFSGIPEDILAAEVSMIVPYYCRISVEIEKN